MDDLLVADEPVLDGGPLFGEHDVAVGCFRAEVGRQRRLLGRYSGCRSLLSGAGPGDLVVEEAIGPVALEIVDAARIFAAYLLDSRSDLGLDGAIVSVGTVLRDEGRDRRLDQLLIAFGPDAAEVAFEA